MPTTTALTPAGTSLSDGFIPESTHVNVNFNKSVINGVNYTNAMVISVGSTPGEVQINAGRSYTHFTGQLGIPDDQKSSSAYKVDISVDNAAPILSTEVHFGETKTVNLNVSNALRIKIAVSGNGYGGNVAIGNPTLGS